MSGYAQNVSAMKIARVTAGYSQEKLAAETNSYTMRISRIERGAKPTCDEARKIAEVLRVKAEDLFTVEDP